jgi:hypothetical protein
MIANTHPALPTPDDIATATEVRQRLIQAACKAAPIQALAAYIGFGCITFKIQDHRVIRVLVETSQKTPATSPGESPNR